jgi:hypothetical protein
MGYVVSVEKYFHPAQTPLSFKIRLC